MMVSNGPGGVVRGGMPDVLEAAFHQREQLASGLLVPGFPRAIGAHIYGRSMGKNGALPIVQTLRRSPGTGRPP